MNLFKKYIEHWKDNPNGYWFKRKLYGWGWTPVKWQGWVVIFIWMILFIFGMETMDHEWLKNLVVLILITWLLIYICYKKGEKPKWQWGIKK